MVDVSVTFEEAVAGLDVNLARVSLSSQVELDHRDAQKLCVRAYICGHWHLAILDCICNRKVLKTFWWVSDTRNWNILDYQVCELVVWLSMLWTEKELEINILASLDLALSRLYSVVSVLVFQRNLLSILLFIDAPVEWYENR